MKAELNMVSGRRSAQLERLLDKFQFDKGDIRGRNPYLEEKISKHKLEIDRYDRIMGQYDSKFVEINAHIDKLNQDKQEQFDEMNSVITELAGNFDQVNAEN